MKKRVAILLENFFEDAEALYPYYRLKEEDADVCFVGPERGKEYKGKWGYPALADKGIGEVTVNDFDAIIIPGGYSPDHMRRHQKMIDLVRDAHRAGKILAAICHGPWMLISGHCLKGKTVTSFFAIKDDCTNAGAEWVDREVVRDGNIITARKPADLPAFCKTIIQALTAA